MENLNTSTMTPKQCVEILTVAIKNKLQVLLVGKPAIGKTAIILEVCKALDADLVMMHPAISDPTDFKGLPSKSADETHAEFLAFGETWKLINAKKLTLCFVDDLGQASESVQKALMQLLHGRKLNGHTLSDDVVFIGATNDTMHKAGVTGLIEPVKSRWDSIIHLEPNADDWTAWAIANNVPYQLIAFVRSRPELINSWEATKAIINQPSPRTIFNFGKWISLGIKNFEVLAGACGKGFAMEYLAFEELANEAPDLDEIIKNPKTSKVPEKPSLKYLVSCGLATKTKKENFKNVFEYLQRMPEPFRILSMRDIVRKDKTLMQSEIFIKWASTEGKEIFQR